MKKVRKLLAVLLSLSVVAVSFAAFGITANAASKFNAQKQQYNSLNSSVNFNGNEFAFVSNYNGTYELHYAPVYGGSDSAVYSTGNYISSLAVKGKFIYFVDYSDGVLRRVKKDGTGLKKIVKLESINQNIQYIISGKRIIYQVSTIDESTYQMTSCDIFTCSLTGKNKKRIIKGVEYSNFYTFKNKLYYKKNGRIYSYTFKTKKSATVKKLPEGTYIVGMDGGILYYIEYNYDDDYNETIKCFKLDVTKKKSSKIGTVKPKDGFVHSMIITDGKVFVVTGTGAGDAFAQLKKGKLDYKSFRSKYNMCADYMGYYQNRILIQDTDDNYAFLGMVEVASVK